MTRGWLVGGLVGIGVLAPVVGWASLRLGESPHGRPGGGVGGDRPPNRCAACHAAAPDGARGAPLPVVATCRGCHPDAEMHPVGMRPERVAVPDGWPLEDGAVSCATCHAEPGCDPARSPAAPWLRGGTPARKADFCARCHASAELVRRSPHPTATGALPACPACHVARPTPGTGVAGAGLLLPPDEACATCHPAPVHAGAAEHLGAVPDDIAATDAVALPLGPDGRIGCWTCHDVHTPPRTAPQPSPLGVALRPRDGGSAHGEALLALPVSDGHLCRACHGVGP